MPPWLGIVLVVACVAAAAGAVATAWLARAHARTVAGLEARARRPPAGSTSAADFSTLPPPVQRYLRRALPENSRAIRLARSTQTGFIRTATDSAKWMAFTAVQVVAPPRAEFVWTARVSIAALLHLQVRDALLGGVGSGRVLLMSALPLAASAATPEMNAGALHRFLAESPWYPSALWPSPALRWTPIDERRALATLTQGSVSVALEFRFNEDDEIVGIWTPARWGRFGRVFEQRAWEGHFARWRRVQGVWIPGEGEVGWYEHGRWQAVWRGTVVDAHFEFMPSDGAVPEPNTPR